VYRLFSWEHSYFSGKVRAYLRYKDRCGDLGPGYEDVLATPELVQGLLLPRSGSGAVPQLETPEGEWIQDSSEILDVLETRHTAAPIVPGTPVQRVVSYLIELLADEWMVVPGFWERWYFSEDGRALNHRGFNEQQWGAMLAAGRPGAERRLAGADFFDRIFGISTSRSAPRGVYAGLVHLGVDERTEPAWQSSQHRLLARLEHHFGRHDYVLGGRPSLADFALLGPLYAHLYRDAVAGFALRAWFPLVCEWVERTNGEGALNARRYGQQLYGLDGDGRLVARPACSDGAAWLPHDAVADSLRPVVAVFFEEMWPVLCDAMATLTAYLESDAHEPGGELPGKTFTATPGFESLQTGDGPLTHAFAIGGVRGRRMVVPYQVWMLQRLAAVLDGLRSDERAAVGRFLAGFAGGGELLDLDRRLAGCRVRKQGARLYAER